MEVSLRWTEHRETLQHEFLPYATPENRVHSILKSNETEETMDVRPKTRRCTQTYLRFLDMSDLKTSSEFTFPHWCRSLKVQILDIVDAIYRINIL